MPPVESVSERTERTRTYDLETGLRRTDFCASPVFLPDLKTQVDLAASRVSGTDIVYDTLAGNASVSFSKDSASYLLKRGGAEMSYQGPAATRTGQAKNKVTYTLADGTLIEFCVCRTQVMQRSKITIAGAPVPAFKRVADAKGIDAFAFLRPAILSGDLQDTLQSGDVTFDAKGNILTGLDPSKLAAGKFPCWVDPTSTFNPGAGDGPVQNAVAGNPTWASVRNAASGTLARTNLTEDSCAGAAIANPVDTSRITRGFFPFDTSVIRSNAKITAATLRLYVDSLTNPAANGASVIQTSQASTSTLATSDYSLVTLTNISDVILFSAMTTPGNVTWTLTSPFAAISKTGFSKLGVVSSEYDVANVQPPSGGASAMSVDQSEGPNPPLLSVTYFRSIPIEERIVLMV